MGQVAHDLPADGRVRVEQPIHDGRLGHGFLPVLPSELGRSLSERLRLASRLGSSGLERTGGVTTTPTSSVLGRRAELDEIEGFLDSVAEGTSRLLLLSGHAGIGKTTLMSAGIDAARAQGYRVVSAHPSEVETGLGFAALGDLLSPLLHAHVADLPKPQREALDVALLRASAASPPDPLGVSLATLQYLRDAAGRAPLLVTIDDVPWLDEASVRALDFAIRRLREDRVGFLLARRAATPGEPLPRWLAGLPADRIHRLDVGPLSMADTDALLRQHLDLSLVHPVLARLHAISGGTPFYAIELGRDFQTRGTRSGPTSLEVPRSLELVGARVAALDPAADEVALHAAALAQPTVHVLSAALGADRTTTGLEGAVAAGLVEVEDDIIRFAHPLLAAAAYGRATPKRRRRVHERLAKVVSEPEERARHLARTVVGTDASVAQALEDAATVAALRGASEMAAELAEDAARLTPADAGEERQRRRFVAAEHLAVSGDLRRADAILGEIASDLSDGPLRARVLTRRALGALYLSDLELAEQLLRSAMPLAADDPRRRVIIHALLAGIGHLSWRGWRHARLDMFEALRLVQELGDAPLELQMLGHAATWTWGLGRPWRGLMERADALGVPMADVPLLEHPDLQFARLLAREGDIHEGRVRLERLMASARAAGDWTSLPRLLVAMVSLETEAGAWAHAERLADEAEAGLLQSGQGAFYDDLMINSLALAVSRGDVEAARAIAADSESLADASPSRSCRARRTFSCPCLICRSAMPQPR